MEDAMKNSWLAGMLALVLTTGCVVIGNRADTGGAASPAHKKLIGAKVTLKADQVDAFIAAAKDVITASRAEPGCISYTLYQSPYDKTQFFFFEEWRNQAAIDFHFETPHFKTFGENLKTMTAAPADIVIYDCPSGK